MSTATSSCSNSVEDRRRAQRFPLAADGEVYLCTPNGGSESLRVRVKDVSTTGMGVVSGEALPIGQAYRVKESTEAAHDNALFTVVRSDRMEDGRYSIGLQSDHSAKAVPCSAGSCSGVKRVATVLAAALAIGAVTAALLK